MRNEPTKPSTMSEPVSVLASFAPGPRGLVRVTPHIMKWRGKRWKLDTMGLYHPEKRGTKRIHIFSFSADETAFRVELDPETLEWKLTEVFYG
jgi:hypothetical protein